MRIISFPRFTPRFYVNLRNGFSSKKNSESRNSGKNRKWHVAGDRGIFFGIKTFNLKKNNKLDCLSPSLMFLSMVAPLKLTLTVASEFEQCERTTILPRFVNLICETVQGCSLY